MDHTKTNGAKPAILLPEKPHLVTANGQPVGDPAQAAETLRLEQEAAKASAINDVTKLQLYVARIEKAAGKNVDQRIMMGALAVVAAKVIAHSPIRKHHALIQSFMSGVAQGVIQTYTQEQREALTKLALEISGAETPSEGETNEKAGGNSN